MTTEKKMPIGRQIVYLTDFDDEADNLEDRFGMTTRHKFHYQPFNKYFGGGFGRPDNYEIVLTFGDTGIGKSTFVLNMLIEPLLAGATIGLLALEDDGADVNVRFRRLMGKEKFAEHARQIHFTPPDVVDGSKLWGLDALLDLMEDWFKNRKLDIIVLDHLQFAFESATAIKGENEWVAQRVFVRRLNYLVRKYKKTVILVSHINKTVQAKGMQKVQGSGGIAGSATKVIEVYREVDKNGPTGKLLVMYHKSRFTPTPDHPRAFKYDRNGLITDPWVIEKPETKEAAF